VSDGTEMAFVLCAVKKLFSMYTHSLTLTVSHLLDYSRWSNSVSWPCKQMQPAPWLCRVSASPKCQRSNNRRPIWTYAIQIEYGLRNVRRRDICVILGDWNAKIGSVNTGWDHVMGP